MSSKSRGYRDEENVSGRLDEDGGPYVCLDCGHEGPARVSSSGVRRCNSCESVKLEEVP